MVGVSEGEDLKLLSSDTVDGSDIRRSPGMSKTL